MEVSFCETVGKNRTSASKQYKSSTKKKVYRQNPQEGIHSAWEMTTVGGEIHYSPLTIFNSDEDDVNYE